MNHPNPEREFSSKAYETETSTFLDKFRELLPNVDFEESAEMLEARTAVLEAFVHNQDPDFLRTVWIEYAKVCEQIVDSKAENNPQTRAKLQIATLIHKALIFREVGDTQCYGQDLSDAEEYAANMHFDEIAEAIGSELYETQSLVN